MDRPPTLSQALEELLALYPELVKRMAQKCPSNMEPMDASQEVVARALERLAEYTSHPSGIAPWALAIAKNVNREARRARKREKKLFCYEMESVEDAMTSEQTPEEKSVSAELRNRLQTVLETMPPSCAQAFVLIRLMGLTYEEGAEQLGIPVGTMKSRTHAALRHLRMHLGAKEDFFGIPPAALGRRGRYNFLRSIVRGSCQAAHLWTGLIAGYYFLSYYKPYAEEVRFRPSEISEIRTALHIAPPRVPPLPKAPAPAPTRTSLPAPCPPFKAAPASTSRVQRKPDVLDSFVGGEGYNRTGTGKQGWSK